jgi:dynactin 1
VRDLPHFQHVSSADTPDKMSLQLREERARSNDLDAVILDMETTLNQFRNLVSDLQRWVRQLERL